MMTSLRGAVSASLAVGGLALAPAAALAPPITVTTKDPSPTVVTRPALVRPNQIIRLREDAHVSNTPVRFKVYPDTSEFKPTNSACAGKFTTAARKTASNHKVVITLNQPKPLCKGVLYQAQALIGTGKVPDKFAHLCVRGKPSLPPGQYQTGCESNPYYFPQN
jgi:hypothetical protein